jgi:hypothetical protein
MLWFLMFEHAPFLLLGSWFALMATSPLAWTLEDSAQSPTMLHRIGLAVLGIAVLAVVVVSGEGLRYALPLGALLCVVSSMLDVRHATLSRQ